MKAVASTDFERELTIGTAVVHDRLVVEETTPQ